MVEMTRPRPNAANPKRYRISMKVLWPRAVMVAVCIGIAPVILAATGEDVDGLLIGIFAGLIVLCLGVFFGVARMSWVTMDEHGIVYKALGFQIVSTWDNIDSIGHQFMQNEGKVEGLKLIASGLDVNGAVKAGTLLSWRATMAFRELEYFIPLSNFQTKAWRDTEFGQELRRHVPRLFEGE